MKELIAFIVMGIVIAALIEINERIKAKKKKDDCPQLQTDSEACTDCALSEACSKKSTT